MDKEKLNNLNLQVRIPLKNLLKRIPKGIESIILFGSSSRKQEKENSDIDLVFVLHKFDNQKLQESYQKEIKKIINNLKKSINSESNYPLNIIITDGHNFKKSKDHLIIQSKKTGFPIYGNYQYYIDDEEN